MSPYDLDVLYIHPGHRTRIYQALGEGLSAVETPIWAGLLANFSRQQGFSSAILDAEAENLTLAQVVSRVEERNPLLTVIVVYGHQPSASTQNMTVSGEIATAIKENNPGRKVMFLGGHVSSLPERTMREEDGDYVAYGEGTHTVTDLLQALKAGRNHLDRVRGLWYREGETLRSTPAPPNVMRLDQELPGMAWDLMPMREYRNYNWHCFGGIPRQPYAALYTTLGCPFRCTFCCIQAPFKPGEKAAGMKESVNSYRYWSPEFILKEIDLLVETYGVSNIRIADEMFVLNQKHVHTLCDLIAARGYRLNMWAYARVDTIKGDETLDKLRRAGVTWLALGIESASEKVRDQVDKGIHGEDIYKTVNKIRQAGINVIANYIFGLPEDDLASMQATLDQALELNCEFANFYSCMAYPGSKLYQTALEEGLALPAKWTGYSQHSVDTFPLPTKHLSPQEVIRFRDNAWDTYFSHPPYLEMIRRKFGPETVAEIKQMAGHKLIRQHA